MVGCSLEVVVSYSKHLGGVVFLSLPFPLSFFPLLLFFHLIRLHIRHKDAGCLEYTHICMHISSFLLHCPSFPSQISELRASVSRAEQQAAWREEHMKQEVADMQQRLQEAEMRNQELTASISQSMFVYQPRLGASLTKCRWVVNFNCSFKKCCT